MAKSNYTYDFKTYKGRNFLVIEDLNTGGMSVTNNIEQVVEDCFEAHDLQPHQAFIIYKDSNGMWDGWSHEKQDYIHLDQRSEEAAKELIILKYG